MEQGTEPLHWELVAPLSTHPHPLALCLRHQAYSGFQVNSQVKMCLYFSKDQPEIYGWILAPSLG